jgi:hypothetical protein
VESVRSLRLVEHTVLGCTDAPAVTVHVTPQQLHFHAVAFAHLPVRYKRVDRLLTLKAVGLQYESVISCATPASCTHGQVMHPCTAKSCTHAWPSHAPMHGQVMHPWPSHAPMAKSCTHGQVMHPWPSHAPMAKSCTHGQVDGQSIGQRLLLYGGWPNAGRLACAGSGEWCVAGLHWRVGLS